MPRNRNKNKGKVVQDSIVKANQNGGLRVSPEKGHVRFHSPGDPIGFGGAGTSSNKNLSNSSRENISENGKNSNIYYLPPTGKGLKPVPSVATLNRLDRQKIVIWKSPLKTIYYFVKELLLETMEYSVK